MKRIYTLMAFILPLCACAGMSSFDGNSTKQWIVIESSKQDLEGKTIDVCYRLDVRFNPEEATQRFDSDKACITKCCWYSETRQINLHLNADFAKELAQTGQANKYNVDDLTFNVRYSNLLNTIHASVKPSFVMRSNGLINLDYSVMSDTAGLLKIDLGDLKVKDYSQEEEDGHKGSYLYKDQESSMNEHQQAIDELKELSGIDTGKTPGEQVVEKVETTIQEEQAVLQNQKTVIGTLQTRESLEAEQKALQEQNAKLQASLQQTVNTINSKTYDLSDPAQRQELLEKKLAYERTQAVLLLKQFYQQDIDNYVRYIDKQQAAKGNVLLANDRQWQATKVGYPVYRITCNVKGKLGKTQNSMKDYPISCGTYEVDLDEKTVSPKDITAITIVNKDYLY